MSKIFPRKISVRHSPMTRAEQLSPTKTCPIINYVLFQWKINEKKET